MEYASRDSESWEHPDIKRFRDVFSDGFMHTVVPIFVGDNSYFVIERWEHKNEQVDVLEAIGFENTLGTATATEEDKRCYQADQSKNPASVKRNLQGAVEGLRKLASTSSGRLKYVAEGLIGYYERDARPLLDNLEDVLEIHRRATYILDDLQKAKSAKEYGDLKEELNSLVQSAYGTPCWSYFWNAVQHHNLWIDGKTSQLQADLGLIRLAPQTPEYRQAMDRLAQLAFMATNRICWRKKEPQDDILNYDRMFEKEQGTIGDPTDRSPIPEDFSMIPDMLVGGDGFILERVQERKVLRDKWFWEFDALARRFENPLEVVQESIRYLERATDVMLKVRPGTVYAFDGKTCLWFYATDALHTADPIQAFKRRTAKIDKDTIMPESLLGEVDWNGMTFTEAFGEEPFRTMREETERAHNKRHYFDLGGEMSDFVFNHEQPQQEPAPKKWNPFGWLKIRR